jgi:hypothetical protein
MAAMPYPKLTAKQRLAVFHPERGTFKRKDNARKDNAPSVSFTSAKLDWITATAYDKQLSPNAFRVGVIIAQHVNEKTGRAYPSEQLIADRAGISRHTVMRSVKLLQDTGWLRIKRKKTFDSKAKTHKTRNSYWLRHENVSAARLGRRSKGADQCSTGATYQCSTGATLTPSVQHPQNIRRVTVAGRMRKTKKPPERMLPLVSVVSNDQPDPDDAVVSAGGRVLLAKDGDH